MNAVRRERPVRASILGAVLLLASLGPATVLTAQEPRYAGRSLEEALLDLRARGLRIVFTSNVVRPEMRVEREPAATDLRRVLEELLAPHGLAAREAPNGIVVVVRGRAPAAGEATAVPGSPPAGAGPGGPSTSPLDPAFEIHEEIVVTPSRISLLREDPVGLLGLSREEILTLPHLGDDFFRALSLLPGTSANDVSARFHVRGARDDETQIVLDGQELFEPFHLQDFDSPFSLIAPATLSGADLSTGGFPARYGDRMSGVLDMTTVRPSGSPRVRLGAGILGFHAGGGGAFAGERGAWLAEARRGSSDLLGKLLGDEDPRYWDAFAKVDYYLTPRHGLRANFLRSFDELDFTDDVGDETKHFETEYGSNYLWLTHQALLGADLSLESAVSGARIERERRGDELEEDTQFGIRDERDSEISELRQGWQLQATPRHLLSWGWQRRGLETEYDYSAQRDLDEPLARIRHDFGSDSTVFAGEFDERDTGAWATDRLRLSEPLTLELGLRHDRHSQTSESHTSPRFNLAYAPGGRSVLRLAWGRFHQSQRPYELEVEDGETAFHPVERAEHRVAGFETHLGGESKARGLELRLEVYQRLVANPRPRYENLFEPLNVFPEVEPDRVLIAPDRSVAEGAELFLRGRLGARAAWWLNYTYATTEDEIAGRRFLRIFDQTHSVNLDFDVRAGQKWRLNFAWRYHTGWPTTPLGLQAVVEEEEDEEGNVTTETTYLPLLGKLNSARLPDYHRLDVRASRRWRIGAASLDLFFDVQNVYDRKNVGGFDFEIDEDEGTLVRKSEAWPGIIPSAGISVEF
jgi:TonB dependent receptor